MIRSLFLIKKIAKLERAQKIHIDLLLICCFIGSIVCGDFMFCDESLSALDQYLSSFAIILLRNGDLILAHQIRISDILSWVIKSSLVPGSNSEPSDPLDMVTSF